MGQPLDYVDTRFSPYFMQDSLSTNPSSWALNTDVVASNYGRLQYDASIRNPRYNDIVLVATEFGGIFRATTAGVWVAADTSLPLPGSPGSLSGNVTGGRLDPTQQVLVTSAPPYVTKVRRRRPSARYIASSPLPHLPHLPTATTAFAQVLSNVPSGTYGINFNLTIVVRYSLPVAVGGCPRVYFRLDNGEDRYAVYVSGTGTTDLTFSYKVQYNDYRCSPSRRACSDAPCTCPLTLLHRPPLAFAVQDEL